MLLGRDAKQRNMTQPGSFIRAEAVIKLKIAQTTHSFEETFPPDWPNSNKYSVLAISLGGVRCNTTGFASEAHSWIINALHG
jgi:hypothetical protein